MSAVLSRLALVRATHWTFLPLDGWVGGAQKYYERRVVEVGGKEVEKIDDGLGLFCKGRST